MSKEFEICLARCSITQQYDKCIIVKLGTLDFVDPETNDPTNKADVYGKFSETGLNLLLNDLKNAPLPVSIPSNDEVRRSNPYGWLAILKSEQRIYQYTSDGEEHHLGQVPMQEVEQFWIVPRKAETGLPAYGLIQNQGFFKCAASGSEMVPLEVDFPEEGFEFRYYRNVTLTFMNQLGQTEGIPANVQQILGWKRGNNILDIAIDPEGNYSVFLREPNQLTS